MFKKDTDTILSQRQRRIYDFLQYHPTGVLTTVDPNGDPHGVVIYYTINKEFNVSFLTKTETKKYDNLMRNGHVMLVVFDQASQTVAQVIGKALEITDNYDANVVAAEILKISQKTSKGGTPPISKLHTGGYTAFKIVPDQIRIAFYDKSGSGNYSDIFESIESFVLKDEDR